MKQLRTQELLDLSKTLASEYLGGYEYPWEALAGLSAAIRSLGATLSEEEYDCPSEGIWIARGATVAHSASLTAPCIIGTGAELRHCAFLRGGVLVGAGAVVGNSTELKNCVLFDGVQVPHYNYIGDSLLGYRAHFGAGAVTSNVKSDRRNVTVHAGAEHIETGCRKLGAIVGDLAEIGCGAVLCPGSIIGRGSIVYPLSLVRGMVPEQTIYKKDGECVERV